MVPDELPPQLRRDKAFGVEVDAMPGGFVCSASLKAKVASTEVKSVIAGQRPLRKLFIKQQRALIDEHTAGDVDLDDLAVLGPIFVLKLKFVPRDLERRMVAELWLYPDGSRILELSTKCRPAEAFDVAAQTQAFLMSRGVDTHGAQQTKTRTALKFFSKELTAAQGR